MEYRYKTEPFKHQRETFEQTRDIPCYGVFWEQGTGKSKLTVDTAAWMYAHDRIDTVLVVAPKGVHRNWIVNEVPAHLPASIPRECLLWESSKANNQRAQKEAKRVLGYDGLLIVAMNYEALMTKRGDDFVSKLIAKRRCLMVLDESARIKSPRARRTVRVLARGKGVTFRRILTGTPVANSPFDIYTQLKFLNPDIWAGLGCRTFAAFKAIFGVWEDRMDPRSGRPFKNLVRYRNLDRLNKIVNEVGSRVTKEDVLDLPPKLYSKRYFEMSATQKRAYKQLWDDFFLEMESGEVDAMLAIVRLGKAQQITSGFIIDDEENVHAFEENPRITLLRDVVSDLAGQFIIWGKFHHDLDLVMAALKEDGVSAVRYDGTVDDASRAEAVERFQAGEVRAFVANPAAAGEGLTLHRATTVIYYNNSFKLTDRLQSEDRAHRIGQNFPVDYIDLIATDTVDERITDALRNKLNIASSITGDNLKEWI